MALLDFNFRRSDSKTVTGISLFFEYEFVFLYTIQKNEMVTSSLEN